MARDERAKTLLSTWRPRPATHFPSGQLTPWSNTNPGGSSESRPRAPLTKAAYSPELEDSATPEKLDASMNHFASWPRPQRFTAGNTIKTIETNHWFCITTLPQRFTAGITVSQSNQSHSGGNHRFCITTTPTKGPQPTTPITKVPAEITDTVSRPRPQRFTPAATWPSAFTTNHIQAEITDSAEGDTATPSKVHGTREGEKKMQSFAMRNCVHGYIYNTDMCICFCKCIQAYIEFFI